MNRQIFNLFIVLFITSFFCACSSEPIKPDPGRCFINSDCAVSVLVADAEELGDGELLGCGVNEDSGEADGLKVGDGFVEAFGTLELSWESIGTVSSDEEGTVFLETIIKPISNPNTMNPKAALAKPFSEIYIY